MSQALVAEESGVSLGSIKRFEQAGKISLESLLKLAQRLGRLSEFEPILVPKEDLAEIEKLFSDKTRQQ
ncbi:MAG: helix-turn-helix domain-containing protein [Bacteroidetes bacterium]|nr:helix-turn-helix domain-containing protein [Bacteroidota bacterium]